MDSVTKHLPILPRLALCTAAAALTVGALRLVENHRLLQEASMLTERLAIQFRPTPNDAFLQWLDPWLEQWMAEHGVQPQNPLAVRAKLTEHLIRFGAVATHENVVRQSRIRDENAWILAELTALVGAAHAQAMLLDAHNMWGRQFQGLDDGFMAVPERPQGG